MFSARQTNKDPILAKNVWLNTYEIECSSCHELRWPTLPEKPRSYECARCRSGAGAGKRESGRRGGEAAQRAQRARIEQKPSKGGS